MDTQSLNLKSPSHRARTKILKEPQEVAIRVSDDELPVPALCGTDTVPLVFDREEKWVLASAKGLDEWGNSGHTDLDVYPFPKGIGDRKMPCVEGAALSNLVDHQLCLP